MWPYLKRSIPANIVLLLLAACFAVWTFGVAHEALVLRSQYREVQARTAELMAKKAETEAKLAELDTPAALEREAKLRLNLKNPGEHVVIVVPEKSTPPPPPQPAGVFARIRAFLSHFLPF